MAKVNPLVSRRRLMIWSISVYVLLVELLTGLLGATLMIGCEPALIYGCEAPVALEQFEAELKTASAAWE